METQKQTNPHPYLKFFAGGVAGIIFNLLMSTLFGDIGFYLSLIIFPLVVFVLMGGRIRYKREEKRQIMVSIFIPLTFINVFKTPSKIMEEIPSDKVSYKRVFRAVIIFTIISFFAIIALAVASTP